jgi:two-component system NarL family sensor kinase
VSEQKLPVRVFLTSTTGAVDRSERLFRPVVTGKGGRRAVVRELEKERARIGRELHAGAGQPLAGIRLNLEMLEDRAAELSGPAQEILLRLRILTDQALNQVRVFSHQLHPLEWQSLTLEAALRQLAESMFIADRLKVDLEVQFLPVEPDQSVKIAVYRIVQECLANTLRHSAATRVSVTLRLVDISLEISILDNGAGFSTASCEGPGIGLRSLRQYAESLGGTTEIRSDGGGTRIFARIQLAGEQE